MQWGSDRISRKGGAAKQVGDKAVKSQTVA